MYGGFWVPNKSHAMGNGNEFHVGPHIMIIGLDQKMLQTLNHDGSNGQAYVNHIGSRSELYLVIPIPNGMTHKQKIPLAARRQPLPGCSDSEATPPPRRFGDEKTCFGNPG
jgi:hypothetical protein